MAYLQTSASDIRGLLEVIRNFLVPLGWTVAFDNILTTGQLGIYRKNCFIILGHVRNSSNTADYYWTVTDYSSGSPVSVSDYAIVLTLLNQIPSAANGKYWGDPGNTHITTSVDSDICSQNDLAGPFSNVWLFSNADGDYCNVVVQATADRFTHFSFGNVDKQGMSHPDVGYCCADFWEWYAVSDNPNHSTVDMNRIDGSSNSIGHFGGTVDRGWLYTPSGVLNPTYGFSSSGNVSHDYWDNIKTPTLWDSDEYHGSAVGAMNDGILCCRNQVTTGGVPMMTLPIIYRENSVSCYLGAIPDMRLMGIENIAPAQSIYFGSDEWVCFPIKRKTDRTKQWGGANVELAVSSGNQGYAFRKIL